MPQIRSTTLPHGLVARAPFAGLIRSVKLAWARRRDRAQLARLDPHLLQDIGLTNEAAQEEAAKPFWQR